MKVLKFGGSSVQNAENIVKAVGIIKENLQKEHVIIVVSALGGITNKLIDCCNKAVNGDKSFVDMLAEIKTAHFETINSLLKVMQKLNAIKTPRLFLPNCMTSYTAFCLFVNLLHEHWI